MKIKCVALDLDRTTLNAQGKLSAGNRQAIMDAVANGVHVCIASGRAFDTLPQDVLTIPGVQYAITGNGSAIYKIEGKQCLQAYKLPAQAVSVILETVPRAADGYPFSYEAFIDGTAYAAQAYLDEPEYYGATPQAVHYVRSTRHPQKDMAQFLMEHREELDGMDVIVNGEAAKQRIWRQIAAATSQVYLTSSVRQLIEIAHRDAGKHTGLQFLMQMLGVSREETAAFGDGDNDAEMLDFAGCGIAVENGSLRCRTAADYITLSHDQDGVAYGFRHILHIC